MIVYIMGTGRSGSTLLGGMIASCAKSKGIHVGEINHFFDYHGKKPFLRTEWERNVQRFYDDIYVPEADYGWTVFIERYVACMLYILGVLRRPTPSYKRKTKKLLDDALNQSESDFLVDSSKYPLRLMWLNMIYDNVVVVRIRRKPASYYSTVAKKNDYQPRQGLMFAWLYYNIVNIMSWHIYRKFDGTKAEIFVEDLQEDYLSSIRGLFDRINIPFEENHELTSGHVFEGNRMAAEKFIVVREARSKNVSAGLGFLERLSWKR